MELEWLAQTCEAWRTAAWSSSFWSVLDKDRFALFFDSDNLWSNRRDRTWKLDEVIVHDGRRIDVGHVGQVERKRWGRNCDGGRVPRRGCGWRRVGSRGGLVVLRRDPGRASTRGRRFVGWSRPRRTSSAFEWAPRPSNRTCSSFCNGSSTADTIATPRASVSSASRCRASASSASIDATNRLA